MEASYVLVTTVKNWFLKNVQNMELFTASLLVFRIGGSTVYLSIQICNHIKNESSHTYKTLKITQGNVLDLEIPDTKLFQLLYEVRLQY